MNRVKGKLIKVIEGGFPAPIAKIAIVISRFNSLINESLLSGAIDTFKRHALISDDNITVVRCPDAVELPLVAQRVAKPPTTMRLSLWVL